MEWISTITLPSRQFCRKSSVEECIFDYMALHIRVGHGTQPLLVTGTSHCSIIFSTIFTGTGYARVLVASGDVMFVKGIEANDVDSNKEINVDTLSSGFNAFCFNKISKY